ncbi:MAG TPA: arabinofuranosidase catalytic domain-containing protein [Nitrospira sp.]|nr:arabinofuranosidase catalytic domain-containing protein [Nitrospira sp.]
MNNLLNRKSAIIKSQPTLITRRSLLISAVALPLFPTKSHAWLIQSATCLSSSYTGPGDVFAFDAWGGVRAYSQSYAASCGNAFDLRRASDNATMTAKVKTTGALDDALISSWASGSNIFISKIYDQTGGGHHWSQATNSNQPQLFLSGGPGGFPYWQVSSSAQQISSGNNTPSSPTTLTVVGNRVSGTDPGVLISIDSTTRNSIRGGTLTANQWQLVGGGGGSIQVAGTNDNTWHNAIGVINGASSVFMIDGTDHTGTTTSSSTTGVSFFPSTAASTMTIRISEGGWKIAGAASGTERTDLSNNERTYYGL